MLKTFRAGAAIVAATLTIAASPAAADNQDILIMDNAFFPELSYVQPGDTITFINISGIPRYVKAIDSSWRTVNLHEGETAVVTVEQRMVKDFQLSERGNIDNGEEAVGNGTDGALTDDNALSDDTTATEEDLIFGKLNFAAPPQLTSN